MDTLPDDLRVKLGTLRVCRANGIAPRVLVPERALSWVKDADARGGSLEVADDLPERVIAFARRTIGVRYRIHAEIQDAPGSFSCSSLVKFAFASVGIWMPRYAIDQSYLGVRGNEHAWIEGNLVFWKSEWPIRDQTRAIGHVGIATGTRRLNHAGQKDGVVSEIITCRPDLASFSNPFPAGPQVLLFPPPDRRGLETALDVVRFLQR